jgi:hypothetical protein
LKEGSFGSIKDQVYAPIPLGEMMSLRNGKNGRAWCQSNKYLYFGIGERVVRYYSGMLDDVGFTLPSTRKGIISSLVSYPGGTVFAAVDAGVDGYSSVLKYNGRGWCEIWRGPLGARIQNLYIQNVEGCPYQKLFVGMGQVIGWLPISIKPESGSFYWLYNESCYLITSWFRTSFESIRKFWSSIRMNASAVNQSLSIDYQTEADTATWTSVDSSWKSTDSETIAMSATNSVYGKKIRFKITIGVHPGINSSPSYIEGIGVDAVTRVPVKRSFRVQYRIEDYSADLLGGTYAKTAAQIRSQLRSWEDSRVQAVPILMRTLNSLYDNVYVFVEPGSVRPLQYIVDPSNPDRIIGVGQLTLIEA